MPWPAYSPDLNPIYISTSTDTLSSAIMGYLVNISSDVQTQLNAKQSILWNYNTGEPKYTCIFNEKIR